MTSFKFNLIGLVLLFFPTFAGCSKSSTPESDASGSGLEGVTERQSEPDQSAIKPRSGTVDRSTNRSSPTESPQRSTQKTPISNDTALIGTLVAHGRNGTIIYTPREMGMDVDLIGKNVFVIGVTPTSPAYKNGIRVGDSIVGIEGKTWSTDRRMLVLRDIARAMDEGRTITVKNKNGVTEKSFGLELEPKLLLNPMSEWNFGHYELDLSQVPASHRRIFELLVERKTNGAKTLIDAGQFEFQTDPYFILAQMLYELVNADGSKEGAFSKRSSEFDKESLWQRVIRLRDSAIELDGNASRFAADLIVQVVIMHIEKELNGRLAQLATPKPALDLKNRAAPFFEISPFPLNDFLSEAFRTDSQVFPRWLGTMLSLHSSTLNRGSILWSEFWYFHIASAMCWDNDGRCTLKVFDVSNSYFDDYLWIRRTAFENHLHQGDDGMQNVSIILNAMASHAEFLKGSRPDHHPARVELKAALDIRDGNLFIRLETLLCRAAVVKLLEHASNSHGPMITSAFESVNTDSLRERHVAKWDKSDEEEIHVTNAFLDAATRDRGLFRVRNAVERYLEFIHNIYPETYVITEVGASPTLLRFSSSGEARHFERLTSVQRKALAKTTHYVAGNRNSDGEMTDQGWEIESDSSLVVFPGLLLKRNDKVIKVDDQSSRLNTAFVDVWLESNPARHPNSEITEFNKQISGKKEAKGVGPSYLIDSVGEAEVEQANVPKVGFKDPYDFMAFKRAMLQPSLAPSRDFGILPTDEVGVGGHWFLGSKFEEEGAVTYQALNVVLLSKSGSNIELLLIHRNIDVLPAKLDEANYDIGLNVSRMTFDLSLGPMPLTVLETQFIFSRGVQVHPSPSRNDGRERIKGEVWVTNSVMQVATAPRPDQDAKKDKHDVAKSVNNLFMDLDAKLIAIDTSAKKYFDDSHEWPGTRQFLHTSIKEWVEESGHNTALITTYAELNRSRQTLLEELKRLENEIDKAAKMGSTGTNLEASFAGERKLKTRLLRADSHANSLAAMVDDFGQQYLEFKKTPTGTKSGSPP